MELKHDSHLCPELVVFGASWGGLAAMGRLLERLPRSSRYGMALVQHRGPQASQLASILGHKTPWHVREADDKERIGAGTLYVAPPGYHLMVDADSLALSTDEPLRYSRPSIDVLFESAADAYGARLVAVLLTGANDDGARGLARVQAQGGVTIVQDPATAARGDMPRAALAIMTPDLVAPLDAIAAHIAGLCGAERQGAEGSGPDR